MCIRDRPAVIARLQGTRAIGHTRYATTGGAGLRNVQPLFAELADGGFAVAHNGNLTNACLLYTSDAADERSSVDLGGRRII